MEKTLKELKENPYVKGTTPTELRFGDVTLRVNSWRNLYQTPANYFYKRDSKNFEEVVFSDKFKTTSRKPLFIKDEHKAGFRPALIGNGIYMRVTQTLVEICTKRLPELLEAFGYNPDEATVTFEKNLVHETEDKTQALSQITADMKFSDLISFNFQGTEHQRNSWPKMYVEVCKLLFALDEQKFEQILPDYNFENAGRTILFSTDTDKLGDYTELIGAGIYADTNCDANHHILRLKALFNVLGVPSDDLIITCKVVVKLRNH